MTLRVLVGCERSGVVRDAFLAQGFDAWSCDLKNPYWPSRKHILGDVRDVLGFGWDMAILHPPCTRLCKAGARWLITPPSGRTLKQMNAQLIDGAELFSACWNAPIPYLAVENPPMHRWAKALIRNYAPPDQVLQPWWFGTDPYGPDNVKKQTGLWLRRLPQLIRTGTLDGSTARAEAHHAADSPGRADARAYFPPGLAQAMAAQWPQIVEAPPR